MIIKGTFDPVTRRPYCQGLLFIPEFNKKIPIDFIVDTGSDITTLNPGDGKRMKLNYPALSYTESAIGVNSEHRAAALKAILAFVSDEGFLPVYGLKIHVTPYSEQFEKLPSLLGNDILQRWRMDWHPSQNILNFEIESYDGLFDQGLF